MNPSIWFLVVAAFAGFARSTHAAPVLSIVSGLPDGTARPDTTHGWQFSVNSPIVVTDLGLFDNDNDGLRIDYPIGIYRLRDASLLTSGLVHAGIGDTLIERFRYVDTPDITLDVGEQYVIAWYVSATPSDKYFSALPAEFFVNPVITRSPNTRVQLPFVSSGGLALPTLISTDHKVGPNFLFYSIPEPSTLLLAIAAFTTLQTVRRKPVSHKWCGTGVGDLA